MQESWPRLGRRPGTRWLRDNKHGATRRQYPSWLAAAYGRTNKQA